MEWTPGDARLVTVNKPMAPAAGANTDYPRDLAEMVLR